MSKRIVDFDKEDYGSRPQLSKKEEKILNEETNLVLNLISSNNKVLFAVIFLVYLLITGIKYFRLFKSIKLSFVTLLLARGRKSSDNISFEA